MTIDDCSNNSLIGDNRKGGAIRLQIVPAQPKTLSHLPTRPAVDLAFHDLVYSVREGRRNRKYQQVFVISFPIYLSILFLPIFFVRRLALSLFPPWNWSHIANNKRVKIARCCSERFTAESPAQTTTSHVHFFSLSVSLFSSNLFPNFDCEHLFGRKNRATKNKRLANKERICTTERKERN